MAINYLTEKLLSNEKEIIITEYDEEIFFNTKYVFDNDVDQYTTYTKPFKKNENNIHDYELETKSISIESLEEKIKEAKSLGANYVKIDSVKDKSGSGYIFEYLNVEVSKKEDIINYLKEQKYSELKKISKSNSRVESLDFEITKISKRD